MSSQKSPAADHHGPAWLGPRRQQIGILLAAILCLAASWWLLTLEVVQSHEWYPVLALIVGLCALVLAVSVLIVVVTEEVRRSTEARPPGRSRP